MIFQHFHTFIIKNNAKKLVFLFLALLLIFFFSSCEHKQDYVIMSTFLSINAPTLKEISNAYNKISYINSIMNIYDNTSLISELNTKKRITPNKDIIYLINKSLYYSELTNGSFDITVYPLILLYKKTYSLYNRSPTEEEIYLELKKVGYKNIILNLTAPELILLNNATVDLGGIAKGYAIDLALDEISKGMINLGGQIGVKNRKTIIALSNPNEKGNYITKFRIENGCISTSGNYERYFDKSKKAHHIINPKTGYSAQGIISVTVLGINQKGIDCDALSTSLFVLGIEKGISLIESIDGFYALIIDENNTIYRSKGIEKYEIK